MIYKIKNFFTITDFKITMLLVITILFLSIIIRMVLLPYGGNYTISIYQSYVPMMIAAKHSLISGIASTGYFFGFVLFLKAIASIFMWHSTISLQSGTTMIKIFVGLFDYVLAFYVYKIVKAKCTNYLGIIAAFCILFNPMVLLDSFWWGQTDIMMAALFIAGYYYLSVNYLRTAFIIFGLSFIFKAQCFYILPPLIIYMYLQNIKWRYLLFIPSIMVISIIPFKIAGLSWLNLYGYLMYGLVGASHNLAGFIPNLPLIFAKGVMWVNNPIFINMFILLSVSMCAIVFLIIINNKSLLLQSYEYIGKEYLLKLFTFFTLSLPFILPGQLDRYYIFGQIFLLIYVFFYPKKFYLFIIMTMINICSFSVLYNPIINYSQMTFVVLFVLVMLGKDLLYDSFQKSTTRY